MGTVIDVTKSHTSDFKWVFRKWKRVCNAQKRKICGSRFSLFAKKPRMEDSEYKVRLDL